MQSVTYARIRARENPFSGIFSSVFHKKLNERFVWLKFKVPRTRTNICNFGQNIVDKSNKLGFSLKFFTADFSQY